MRLAGFGIRLGARLIDNIIITIIIAITMFIINIFLTTIFFPEVFNVLINDDFYNLNEEEFLNLIIYTIVYLFIYIFISYISMVTYFTILTINGLQGSIGKALLGLKIIDIEGNKLTFKQAFLRAIVDTIMNSLTMSLIYIMIAVNENKQGLHDKVAKSYVVYKK